MCCQDTEADTPPKGPANATPVWRTVRTDESAGKGLLARKGLDVEPVGLGATDRLRHYPNLPAISLALSWSISA
jgi:hypothetical protein